MAFNFLELCLKKDTEGSDVEVCVRVTVVFGYLLGEVSLIFFPFCLTMKHSFSHMFLTYLRHFIVI